jgi:hypothetical protein
MSTAKKEELIRIARTYYPPRDSAASVEQLPPESQLWEEAWDKAMEWKECDTLIQALQTAFPMNRVARFIQPRKVACIYCIVLVESRDPTGRRLLTRFVGAISVIAPLYLIYVTKESPDAAQPSPRPQVVFSPEGLEKTHADTLAQLIEQHLGYRPFPLQLADVPLPDIFVDFLHSEQPALLTALFANHLENLP